MAEKSEPIVKAAPTSAPSEFTASGEFQNLNQHGGPAWPKHELDGDPLAEFGGLQSSTVISTLSEHQTPELPSGKDKNPVSAA